MAIATLNDLRDYLSFTDDLGTIDDALLNRLLDAAQAHVERMLGWSFSVYVNGTAPPDLVQAVTQLAAHWYTNREAAGDNLQELPFGVREIIDQHREWTF